MGNYQKNGLRLPKNVFYLFILLLFFQTTHLYASPENDTLDIFAKILPRFVLMSTQKEKIKSDIELCVLHDTLDERIALSLIDKVKTSYPEGMKNYQIKLLHSTYEDISVCKNAQLIFMFNTHEENIQNTLQFSKAHTILTISYDNHLLENGVNISLFLGRKVTPYINVLSLKENAIQLENILLRISKIYVSGTKK